MSRWIKRLVWLVVVFALVWLAVIIYWQSTTRLPSEWDLVLYLGVLPLAIFGIGWASYSLIKSPPQKPTPPPAPPKQDPAEVAAQAAKKTAEQERDWTMGVVATALHTAHGTSAAEVIAKLKEGTIPQELDDELTTPEGFPAFASRVPDLDYAPTQEALAAWQKTSVLEQVQWSEQQYRALHLAALAVGELAAVAVERADVQQFQKNVAEGRRNKEDALVPLRLIALWPQRWSAAHQAAASAWVKSLVVASGWPQEKVLLQAPNPQQQDPVALLDFVTVTAHRAKLPTVGILLACDSSIDQDYVDDLYAKQQLFTGKTPQGLLPGEVAAGILFADAQQCVMTGSGPYSQLHRASWASRDKSADAKGRVSCELLGSLTTLALETAKVAAEDIHTLCADSDHRTSREAELAELAYAQFPELDISKDILKVAQATGSVHQMNTTATLCLAHQYVVDEQLPVLCLSLHDPVWRAAVALSVMKV